MKQVKQINKAQYEAIYFNPNITIDEVSTSTEGFFITKLSSNGEVIAKRVISQFAVAYYEIA